MKKILSVLLGTTLEIFSQNLLRNPMSQPDSLPLGFLSHCLKGGQVLTYHGPDCARPSHCLVPLDWISKDLGFQGRQNKIYLALDKSSLLPLHLPKCPPPHIRPKSLIANSLYSSFVTVSCYGGVVLKGN